MGKKNADILRKQDEALAKNDLDSFFAPFTDDVIVHVGGRSKLAGDYKGKEQLQGLFDRFMQALGEGADIQTHEILATDTHGVVLQTFRGERDGDRLEANGVGVMHMSKGQITEAWFFDEDPYRADPWYDKGLA